MSGTDHTTTLRLLLRQETAKHHAALDATTDADELTDAESYARFLTRQYCARLPIEEWVARDCPSDFSPPQVALLIAADLSAMGRSVPAPSLRFELPKSSDPIGLAWAIAGSHLGNRMMLKTLKDASSGLPDSFLADETMRQFWRSLRPQLDRPMSKVHAQPAITAASSVFAHFLTIFAEQAESKAAA